MLLQANDYVELHQRYGCTLQIGGSDQWGNIIAGVRLVRQKAGRDGARADHAAGHGLRRQEVRQVDRRRQPLARPGDDQPLRLVPVLRQHRRRRRRSATCGGSPSCRPTSSAELEQATAERPHERAAQRRLARELTTLVHGEAATDCGRARQPGAVRPGRAGRARRADAGGGVARGVGRRADARRSRRHHRPAGGQRVCRRARAPRGGRSPRAASTSTTCGSTATSGCRSRRTSCTAAGWCCDGASGIVGVGGRDAGRSRRRTGSPTRRPSVSSALGGAELSERHALPGHLTPRYPSRNLSKSSRHGPARRARRHPRGKLHFGGFLICPHYELRGFTPRAGCAVGCGCVV